MSKTASLATFPSNSLSVSTYDRFSGLMVATSIMLAFLVAVMFMIWLSSSNHPANGIVFPIPTTPDTTIENPDDGKVILVDITEFRDTPKADLAEAIKAVTEAISKLPAAENGTNGIGLTDGRMGPGGKSGDPSPPGTPEPIPEYKRWEISYKAKNINDYAAQLDHFGIAIGAINRTENEIFVIRDLTKTKSNRVEASTRKQQSKTLRFTNRSPLKRRWDATLATRAGIKADDCYCCQFFFDKPRKLLRELEAAYLLKIKQPLENVRRITFEIKSTGKSDFEIVVTDVVLR